MQRWQGKTAVISGASAGIGAAICVVLADAGMRVVGLARRPQLVDQLQSQVRGNGSIHSRRCDVSNSDDVAATFKWIDEQFGNIHALVNNAGIFPKGHITEIGDNILSEETLMSVVDINLKGPVMCARHAVASMKRASFDGHIININSIAGHYVPFADMFNVYPGTKHAITAFTETLANELAYFNSKIKITSLSPGLVDTDMAPRVDGELSFAALSPQDVAEVVLYVLSTPPHVNIKELTITPVSEKRL